MKWRTGALVAAGVAATLWLTSCPNPLQEIIRKDVAPKYALIVVMLDTRVLDQGEVVDYGGVVVDTAKELTFTIENAGTGSLGLTGDPLVAVGGTDGDSFLVTVPPASPVDSAGNTWFTLSLSPQSVGAKSATVTIESTDAETPTFSFQVVGECTAVPQSEIDVADAGGATIPTGTGSCNFGAVGIGLSKEVTLRIRNMGTADLTLPGTPDRVEITGDDTDLFTVTKIPSSPVAASSSTTFKIRFSPVSTGAKTASVSIANNDADRNPYVFALAGEGALLPEMNVTQGGSGIPRGTGKYTWADTQVGGSTDVEFTIENTGTGPLVLGAVSLTGVDASLFSVITPPASPVAAGSTATLVIRFAPLAFGSKSAAVSIVNDDADENPYTFAIDGPAIVGDMRITNASGYSSLPSLVWTGTEYGLAWTDTRDGGSEIYFCRVSAGGLKLGSDVRITATGNACYPSLCWSGTEYGVAWTGGGQVCFARISSEGVKQGADVPITSDAVYASGISLVWAGAEYGVAWQDQRHGEGQEEIYFARISASGSKVAIADPEPDGVNDDDVRVTTITGCSCDPSLAWTGTGYGVAWYDECGGCEIYFARISAAGAKQGSDVRITNALQNSAYPSLAWRGTEYGVAWCDYRDGVGNYEIYSARISAAGVKQGSDVRITNDAAGNSWYPSLAAGGTQYGVAWNESRDGSFATYFARISASGAKSGGDVSVGNADGSLGFGVPYPSLTWTGTYFGVAWSDDRDASEEIYFAVMGATGTKQ